jgi:hypothetical protein
MRWHYTTVISLRAILQDGFLEPSPLYDDHSPAELIADSANERPILWFTSSPNWEETANKALRNPPRDLDREGTLGYFGLARIGVSEDCPLERFLRITRKSRQKKRLTNRLIKTGVEAGSNPHGDWWGTFERVYEKDWNVVQIYSAEKRGWEDFSELCFFEAVDRLIKEI